MLNLPVVCPAELLFIGCLLHALDEGTERFNLCSKEQISKLSIGKKYNEEHDGEAQNIFSTSTKCGGQLCHGLVKTDVLENLKDNRRKPLDDAEAR